MDGQRDSGHNGRTQPERGLQRLLPGVARSALSVGNAKCSAELLVASRASTASPAARFG
ncbi:hypothetical protein AB0L13_01435 [Saccharopolyspora shandongensis]|uniref:hypothetical protein n=1 Tax=Saccharopolyspora shandongensis TaxID=418495 RepID=UPI00342F4054